PGGACWLVFERGGRLLLLLGGTSTDHEPVSISGWSNTHKRATRIVLHRDADLSGGSLWERSRRGSSPSARWAGLRLRNDEPIDFARQGIEATVLWAAKEPWLPRICELAPADRKDAVFQSKRFDRLRILLHDVDRLQLPLSPHHRRPLPRHREGEEDQ